MNTDAKKKKKIYFNKKEERRDLIKKKINKEPLLLSPSLSTILFSERTSATCATPFSLFQLLQEDHQKKKANISPCLLLQQNGKQKLKKQKKEGPSASVISPHSPSFVLYTISFQREEDDSIDLILTRTAKNLSISVSHVAPNPRPPETSLIRDPPRESPTKINPSHFWPNSSPLPGCTTYFRPKTTHPHLDHNPEKELHRSTAPKPPETKHTFNPNQATINEVAQEKKKTVDLPANQPTTTRQRAPQPSQPFTVQLTPSKIQPSAASQPSPTELHIQRPPSQADHPSTPHPRRETTRQFAPPGSKPCHQDHDQYRQDQLERPTTTGSTIAGRGAPSTSINQLSWINAPADINGKVKRSEEK